MPKKNSLQVNMNFEDNTISAFGTLKGTIVIITANNFPNLIKKIKKYIKIETLTLTFQPE
jgi:hypothetical protein